MSQPAFLSVFTPSRTAPQDLEAIFVQRHALLADAVERVRESATTGHKHHLLFVGPRGTGKSHLLTLLVYRVGLDESLNQQLRIAWLNEDETSTTLLELLRRIYQALSKRYTSEYHENDLEPIYDLDSEAAERWLANMLLKKLTGKTLLIAMENLDTLFEGLGKTGQQRLRAFIQEHPVMTIVATAQRLVDDLSKRNSTFFGFFQTEMLATLSVEQAAELLSNIAALNRQDKAAAFLRTPTGRSRVRALHHLSGGNHRIYLVLSQFITGDNINALVEPFAKMIDEMTPYYQERIRWLPPQQRKIVEFLCSRERPTPVKDMARRLFASQQTISSQLKDLREKGYVQSAQRGRESLYEIAEPLMRICVEIKENQAPSPLRLLVDFLRIWYDGIQLDERLKTSGTGSLSHDYLQAAIERNSAMGNLRAQLLIEDFRNELDEQQRKNWMPLIENTAEESEELALACGELAKGNYEFGMSCLEAIFRESHQYSKQVITTAYALAITWSFNLDQFETGFRMIDSLLSLPELPTEIILATLVQRASVYSKLGNIEKALGDYSRVIEFDCSDLPEITAEALLNRGIIKGVISKVEEAMRDFDCIMHLKGVSPDIVARAHYNRGIGLSISGDIDGALKANTIAIDHSEKSYETKAEALFNRAALYYMNDNPEESKKDLKEILSIKNLTEDLYRRTYIALGLTILESESWTEGLSILKNGLSKLEKITKTEDTLFESIVTYLFSSSLSTASRQQRITELAQIFDQHNASNYLGQALIQHIGSVYRDPDETPNADNLNQWHTAWQSAAESEAMQLPLRILRTGIDFINSGAQDQGVLLDLNQEERQILIQAFGLE